jgi:hypothetical protein
MRYHTCTSTSAGVGFVLNGPGNLVFVDLDRCVRDGKLAPWALDLLERFATYAEYSPSGTGVHLIARGAWKGTRHKRGDYPEIGSAVEVYDRDRYFTVTGHAVWDELHEVANCEVALASLAGTAFTPAQSPTTGCHATEPPPLDDQALLELARRSKNGAEFDRLYRGAWEGCYSSHSEADLALCSQLAFYAGPNGAAQVDRMFRHSGLMRATKWERESYGPRTVAKALEGRAEFYSRPCKARSEAAAIREDAVVSVANQVPIGPPDDAYPGWPAHASDDAFYGPAGDLVRTLEPHTEGNSTAILAQFLVAFGNAVGHGPHFRAESDRHAINLYAVMVGSTSKGRKGSSWGHVKRVVGAADDGWAATCIRQGLSSGEGLIWAVRDPVRLNKQGAEGEADPGVTDKRLLALEQEFSSTLRVLERDGNTLSPVLREAWDGGALGSLTKNSPARASDAHISIIAHITQPELRRYLTETEMGNGFANRFLWFCVGRSKCLPEGGNVSDGDLFPLNERIGRALGHARTVGLMERDHAARELWIEVYPALSEGRPGLLGAVTSRAEAQVMRLACIYALLDLSQMIRHEHLRAALALWRYSELSCSYIFGGALGDRIADEIMAELLGRPQGMTRTEIRDHFGRHKRSGQLDGALAALASAGLAFSRPEGTAGRSVERWYAPGGGHRDA